MKHDIRQIIAEYGAANVRIFLTENEVDGFFRNPFGGRREYVVDESRYKVDANYKLGLRLADPTPISKFEPGFWDGVMNNRSFYITDFNHIINGGRGEVFVLVDADNKYQKVA